MKFVFVASIFLHISALDENEVGAVRRHNQKGSAGLEGNEKIYGSKHDGAREDSKDQQSSPPFPDHAIANSAQRNRRDDEEAPGSVEVNDDGEVSGDDEDEGTVTESDEAIRSKNYDYEVKARVAEDPAASHAAHTAHAVSNDTHFKARPTGDTSSSIQMSAGEAICQGSDEVKVTVSKVEGTSSTKEVSISVTWKDADFETETGNIKTSDWSKNYDTGSITKSTHILVEIKKGKQAKKFDYEIGELLEGKDDWTKKEKLTPNGHINLEFECLEKRPERCERNGQCPWNESCSDSNECEADKTDWRPRSGASMMVNYLALALSMI